MPVLHTVTSTTGVPTIVPRPISTAKPLWSEEYYFPRFPKPQKIYIIRVKTGLENWWSNPRQPNWRVSQSDNIMTALTLVSMQGIINRSDVAVYLDWRDSGKLRNAAQVWINPISKYVDVEKLDVEGVNAVEFLWQNFHTHFRGAVLYDPDVPDTINVATMLAGLDDSLMLSPDQLDLPIVKTILAELNRDCSPDFDPINLPTLSEYKCATDLSLLAKQQDWLEPSEDWDTLQENRYHIYQWVYDNLWTRLEKRAIGMISPGAPSSRWLHDAQVYDPLDLASRDYLIALRLPALWLSTVEEPEVTLLERFIQDAQSPIPLLSMYDATEEESVALASRHGDWIPAIPNSNMPISTGNLTVLSAMDIPVQRFQPKMDDAHLFAALGNQPIVTLWSSDGDSIHFIMDRGFHGGVDFYWENVNDRNFGWSINPTLANLSPLVWNYYVETAGRTSFVSGLSGAGYMYPALMDNSQLNAYLDYTARYLSLTGIRTLYIDERSGLFDERLGRLYYQRLKPAGYLGAFATFFKGPQSGITYSYPGVPAPVVRPAYTLKHGNGNQILLNLFSSEPGAIFLDFPTTYSEGKVVQDSSAVGGQAVEFSRPHLSNCCMVIAGPRMTLAPGAYTATYRLKVTNNQSRLPFAHLMLLQQIGNGVKLVDRNLTPSDFNQNGEWQDFSMTFTLDDFKYEVQLWLDYMGGTPNNANVDLYADSITLSREGGPGLPIVSPIFIGLVGPIEPLDEDLRLVTEEFERRGGVLLTPDEFMAALNPEFLIEWATPMIGSDEPVLMKAQRLLDDGQFLQSLYTIREALRRFPERTYTPSNSNVIIQANALVTDMQLDQQAGNLTFSMYSSRTTEIQIKLRFHDDIFGVIPTVTVNSVPVAVTNSIDGTTRLIEFVLAGGSQKVQVMRP